jgi:AcrR family transcriptional regulator
LDALHLDFDCVKIVLMTTYAKPQQPRALATEQRLLDSLNALLRDKSLSRLSIDEISAHAQISRGAFLKRFGTKKQALFVLWQRYCDKASGVMRTVNQNLPTFPTAIEACIHMSIQLEKLQQDDFSANRAMHEDFLEKLMVDPATKMIFAECVDLMRNVQRTLLRPSTFSETGAFAAAQVLISTNYNYVLRAMPGLPRDPDERHELIGEMVALALQR